MLGNNISGKDRIIFPLDTTDLGEAIRLVEDLRSHVGIFKVGLGLIYGMLASFLSPDAENPNVDFERARHLFCMMDGNIFLDGKLDDIPNTTRDAALSIPKIGVKMLNVHASSGIESIHAAARQKGDAKLLVVTVLTSIGSDECVSIFGDTPGNKVLQFVEMARAAGADGIICSPQELVLLKDFSDLIKVVPGVRPIWAPTNDQKRVMTLGEAIKAGADFVVVGRPVSDPPKEIGGSLEAIKLIVEEIERAEMDRFNGG